MTAEDLARKPRVDASVQGFLRKLDHELALDKIRRDIDEFHRKKRELDRSREQVAAKAITLEYTLERVKAQRTGAPMPMAILKKKQALAAADIILPGSEGQVAAWRADAEADIRRLGLTATWGVFKNMNGYANAVTKSTDCAPITNAASYISFKHEAGHCACPCQPTHRRVKRDGRHGTVCAQCELGAWGWAIEHATPRWTREMHEQLAASLPTYLKYATAAEADQINLMASELGYMLARQQNLKARTSE